MPDHRPVAAPAGTPLPDDQRPVVRPAASVGVVAVLGGTGFVGAAVVAELRRRAIEVRTVTAPRITWPAGQPYDARPPGAPYPDLVERLAGHLDGAQAVVNAAGIPAGTAPAGPSLYGANALLPALVAGACAAARVRRYVHLSSAVVQGREPLDETARTSPFSPYSHSKALGERMLLAEPAGEQVLFRSTWVHDAGRRNTGSLVRLARSPLACVAGDGAAPTPQVLIGDIAASVAHLVCAPGPVPPIVLQPASGMTTGLLLRLLGGREPRRVPHRAARAAVRGLRGYGRLGSRACAHARRAEMLLFGRAQVPGWLATQGVVPDLRPEAWRRLAAAERA
jgi:nucleoside-diphosphate-sugar epimerase